MDSLKFKDSDSVLVICYLRTGSKLCAGTDFRQAKAFINNWENMGQLTELQRQGFCLTLESPKDYVKILGNMIVGYEIHAWDKEPTLHEKVLKKALNAMDKPEPGEDWKQE